jgi:hypothetical protein
MRDLVALRDIPNMEEAELLIALVGRAVGELDGLAPAFATTPAAQEATKQSSQKWPSRFWEKTLRKQANLSSHSLGNQGMPA